MSEIPYENLVFQGGGVKGIAFAGALEEWPELVENAKRFAGSSAGAITAFLLALGYTPKELMDILFETNFNKFKDDSFGYFRDGNRLLSRFGIYRGEAFTKWIYEKAERKFKIDDKENRFWKWIKSVFCYQKREQISFKRIEKLTGKELYVTGTNLTVGETEIYSRNNEMDAVDSVRISMSIPFVFAAPRKGYTVYTDGGWLKNYPIDIFDNGEFNKRTLGFRLVGDDEGRARQIVNLRDFIEATIDSIHRQAEQAYAKPCDDSRTVKIPTFHIKATQFDLNEQEKWMLINSGRKEMRQFRQERGL